MSPRRSVDQLGVYTGNANPDFARKICRYLNVELGRAEVFEFANENIFVKILDNVRERDVFLVQPTCSPVNKSIMELLIMIDAFKRASAGTLVEIVRALQDEGVGEIYGCATHGVLSAPAIERIAEAAVREVVVTDTIPLPPYKRLPKITTISVAPLFAEAIRRIHQGESVGALFSS